MANHAPHVERALVSLKAISTKLNDEHKEHQDAKKAKARKEPADHWQNPKLNERSGIVPNVRT